MKAFTFLKFTMDFVEEIRNRGYLHEEIIEWVNFMRRCRRFQHYIVQELLLQCLQPEFFSIEDIDDLLRRLRCRRRAMEEEIEVIQFIYS